MTVMISRDLGGGGELRVNLRAMIQLIYSSKALKPFSTEQLNGLMAHSQARNLRLDITGMLLYDYGGFLQVLEGPEESVDALYASILGDLRHTSIRLLERVAVAEREFRYWSMGFVDLGSSPKWIRAAKQWPEPANEANASSARRYLKYFQEDLYRELTGTHPSASAKSGGV